METGFLRFGDIRIDLRRRLLYRGERLLEPERREFELLRLLVEAHPETLTRRELIDRLWPRQEISDASLAQLIRRTRKLLDDNAQTPRYLRTLHGIGLRLIPQPEPEPSPAARPPRRRVGLLPVVNASGESDNDWVEHGLAEILLQKLEQHPELSVQLIPAKDAEPQQLMQLYGCQALLQLKLEPGFLPRRLSWQLLHASGRPVNEERMEASSIAEAADLLARQLPERLGRPGKAGADRSRHPSHSDNPVANQLYGEALQHLHAGQYTQAESRLRQALEQDADFAWAQVKLADSLYRQHRLDEARSQLSPLLNQRNATMDPAIVAESRQVLSNLLYAEGLIEASMRESAQLIGLAQQQGDRQLEANQWMNLGTSAQCLGDSENAFRDIGQALDIYRELGFEPGMGNALYNLANVHHGLGQWQEAYRRYEQAELIFNRCGHDNHQAQARFEMAMVLRSMEQPVHRVRQALVETRQVFENSGDQEGQALVDVELLHCDIDEGACEASLEPLEKLIDDFSRQQLAYPRFLARHQLVRACLNLKRTQQAHELLHEQQEYQPNDPMFELLHAHCAYEEHDFEQAVELAEAVQQRYPDTWERRHQRLLDGYRLAREQAAWQPLPI